MNKTSNRWYRLDNAGMLYSALQTDTYSSVYRFSAVMTNLVDPIALQRAIYNTMPRFPSFAVRIRKGLFWYYLEPNPAPGPFVKEDILYPCQPIRFHEDHGWLVRFFFYQKRISIEVFHALSDGAGTLIFFQTLLAEYLRVLGHKIPCGNGVLDIQQPPNPEELEDAYCRYVGPVARSIRKPSRAYSNTGTPEPFYTLHVTMGFLSVDKLNAQAKNYGATITEYLTAVLMYVIMEKQHQKHPDHELPVTMVTPVNLRPLFPSKTLRNFMTTVSPSIDPRLGPYTFEEVLHQVRHYLKLHINRQELRAAITQNVRLQKHPLLRMVPVALKNPVMSAVYRKVGTRPYSCNYSNTGRFSASPEMMAHIQHVEVIVGQATVPRSHCVSVSCGNVMEITFAGTQKENDTARDFFRFLVQEGLHVKVQSNDLCERVE